MRALRETPLDKKTVSSFFASSCTLGLLWAWFIFAGNVGPQVFGMETVFGTMFGLASRLSLVVALFALATRRLSSEASYRPRVLFGTACCVASACLFWWLHASGCSEELRYAAPGALAGIAYAVLLHAWIGKNLRRDFSSVFARTLCASALMMLLYIALLVAPGMIVAWCATAIPLAMAALYLKGLAGQVDANRDPAPAHARTTGGAALLASLMLSMFANSLLLFSWIPSNASNWVFAVIPLAAAGCILALVFRSRLTPYLVFAALCAFVCAGIVIVLLLPSSIPLFSSLIFAGFWLLLAFSLTTATWHGANREAEPLRTATRFMGFIVTAAFFAGAVGTFAAMQDVTSLVIAAVLLAFSLALALAKGASTASAGTESASGTHHDSGDAYRAIAREKDLTERECDVFCLLAKGYSLKSIAEKLYVSENTVKSHRRRIYLKLDINSRQELIDLVEANGEGLP